MACFVTGASRCNTLPGRFGLEGHSQLTELAIDGTTLLAKIFELTLVKDFLSRALGLRS